jgi:hypothetical protein
VRERAGGTPPQTDCALRAGEWLGVGRDLPLPYTGAPPGHPITTGEAPAPHSELVEVNARQRTRAMTEEQRLAAYFAAEHGRGKGPSK